MITTREDAILAGMVSAQRIHERCDHHGEIITSPKLTVALALLAEAIDMVAEAACESLVEQGGTPLTPAWHIGEAAVK